MFQRPAKPIAVGISSLALHLLNLSRHSPRTIKALALTSPPPPPPVLPHPPMTQDAASILSLLSNPSGSRQNIDDLLKAFNHKVHSDLVLDVLKGYRVLGRSRTLEFFTWAGHRLGFRLDDALVEYMAEFLGRRKLFDDLKLLLKTVASSKGGVSPRAVAICIRFLGREGRLAEVLALFRSMESELKCRPDNLVFNNLLYVLCKRGFSDDCVDLAVAVFRTIGRPDVYSYSNVIIGLCRFGRLENAFEVFGEMGRAHLAPTRTATNILITKLCGLGSKEDSMGKVNIRNWRRPFEILVPNLLADAGLRPAVEVFHLSTKLDLLPSMHVVNALVTRLCRAGKIEEAVEILKVAESKKPSHVGDCYSIVVKALCEVRKMDEACALCARMIALGLKPKRHVYNSVIQAFCKLGNVGKAQNYFEMMNRKRCEPDCATYTMLIHANCKMQNWEKAYELLLEMVGLGWNPHFETYNLVESFLKENGNLDLLRKLERKLDVQQLYAHCKASRLEAAQDKLINMTAKGCQLPLYARNVFEQAFQRAGKLKIAQELLKEQEKIVS